MSYQDSEKDADKFDVKDSELTIPLLVAPREDLNNDIFFQEISDAAKKTGMTDREIRMFTRLASGDRKLEWLIVAAMDSNKNHRHLEKSILSLDKKLVEYTRWQRVMSHWFTKFLALLIFLATIFGPRIVDEIWPPHINNTNIQQNMDSNGR